MQLPQTPSPQHNLALLQQDSLILLLLSSINLNIKMFAPEQCIKFIDLFSINSSIIFLASLVSSPDTNKSHSINSTSYFFNSSYIKIFLYPALSNITVTLFPFEYSFFITGIMGAIPIPLHTTNE